VLRLAYLSPLPPTATGVADYSAELLPHLAALATVTAYGPEVCNPPLAGIDCRPLGRYPDERWRFDAALFQMGNSRHHAGIYELFRRFPGILVLHDTVLHHFLADHTAGHGNFPAYTRELAYERGAEGAALALAIQFAGQSHPLFALPLVQRLLDLSLGVIVHSESAAAAIAGQTERPIAVVPAVIEPQTGNSRRGELGLPPGTVLFGSFGQVTATRKLDVVLPAFRALLATRPAHFLIVGDVHPEVGLDGLIADLGLADHVTVLGRVPGLADFQDWLTAVDVVVNLRHPTAGETSATALRALSAGKPLLVSATGWYATLPPAVARRVPEPSVAAVTAAMQALAADSGLRAAMGAAGRAYARREHSGARAAAGYVTFITRVLEAVRA
jgi:glycosyltransferase involved in cell wall biosynthesis